MPLQVCQPGTRSKYHYSITNFEIFMLSLMFTAVAVLGAVTVALSLPAFIFVSYSLFSSKSRIGLVRRSEIFFCFFQLVPIERNRAGALLRRKTYLLKFYKRCRIRNL